MKRVALAVLLTLVIACGGSRVVALSTLPPRTCGLLSEQLTVPEFGTVASALPAFLFRGARADVIVYLNATAQASDVDALHVQLENDPTVKSMTYLDHDAAFAEFQSLFSDQPQIKRSLTPSDTPTSFKIVLADIRREEDFRSRVIDQPGVYQVIDVLSTIRSRFSATESELKPKLRELLSSGGTAALIAVVGVDQRVYAALDKDPSARLFGPGGVVGDDEFSQDAAAADTLQRDIARDCTSGVSS